MIYAAIDTETTGLGERCSLLELAIVLEDTSARPLPPVEELPFFQSLVDVSEGAWWELFPIEMHRKSGLLEELSEPRKTGLRSLDEVDDMAATWLSIRMGHAKLKRVTPAGKNFAGFDKRFLGPRLSKLLHHRALDPGSVFVDFSRADLPGLNDLIDFEQKPGAHRALEDARDVVRVLRRRYA